MAYVLALLRLAIGYWFYMEWSSIGLPDGHKTELNVAYEKIYPAYMAVSVLLAVLFARAGYRIEKSRSRRTLFILATASVFFVAFAFGSHQYLLKLLEHGQGG